ncbi:hypothetical protein AZI86_03440 [Bdellovibrio bacteriovorus]|uniref:Uncharacterized protein n=1 Tax=Bdellovibrio bacteriovorus TaxID=959 RepID=A0A150WP04_BDEBC|nr:hypothetical protein [Bdellovibrio bacteriovorus]KYG66128.1 hypothetical protein AZI86_03440 [Bdellovibrio bacteriovorus]
MEKISGIIPASARTQIADVSVSQPARPGAPALGRPMGKNSLGDRVAFSKQLEEFKKAATALEGPAEIATPDAPVYKNPTEAKKLKVVDELNKKFFSNPKTEARVDGGMTKSEETLKSTNDLDGLFFVEKELKPTQAPLKEISDNNAV